jgi:hypothetical protein
MSETKAGMKAKLVIHIISRQVFCTLLVIVDILQFYYKQKSHL